MNQPGLADLLITACMILVAMVSFVELWKESRKAAISTVSAFVLAFSWIVYDRDNPTTGLAALVYPDHVIDSRIEAKQEAEKLKRLVAEIKAFYSKPLFIDSELRSLSDVKDQIGSLEHSIEEANKIRKLMTELRET